MCRHHAPLFSACPLAKCCQNTGPTSPIACVAAELIMDSGVTGCLGVACRWEWDSAQAHCVELVPHALRELFPIGDMYCNSIWSSLPTAHRQLGRTESITGLGPVLLESHRGRWGLPSFPLQLLHNGNPWQQKLDFAAVLMQLHPCWILSLEEGTKPDKLFCWKSGELRNKGDPVLCCLPPHPPPHTASHLWQGCSHRYLWESLWEHPPFFV